MPVTGCFGFANSRPLYCVLREGKDSRIKRIARDVCAERSAAQSGEDESVAELHLVPDRGSGSGLLMSDWCWEKGPFGKA
jgi:hypothetical protein